MRIKVFPSAKRRSLTTKKDYFIVSAHMVSEVGEPPFDHHFYLTVEALPADLKEFFKRVHLRYLARFGASPTAQV